MLDKIAYRSKRPKKVKSIPNLELDFLNLRDKDDHDAPGSNTEMGGRGIQVPGVSSDNYNTGGTDPEQYEENLETLHPSGTQEVEDEIFDMLVGLGDGLDDSEEYRLANFADFLIKKFAEAKDLDGEYLYRKLMIRIASADTPNTNEILKKLTAVFSRTILIELTRQNNLESAKKSAYKKILHRAEQYLEDI